MKATARAAPRRLRASALTTHPEEAAGVVNADEAVRREAGELVQQTCHRIANVLSCVRC